MNRFTVLIATAAIALACGPSLSAATPPIGGTISIEPKTPSGDYDPATRAFADGAAEALAARGFTILDDPGHAAYVAELTLAREEVGTGRAKVPAGRSAVLPGASAGVGAGVVIPFSTGKSTLVPLERTRLELRIHKRGEDATLWAGAAVTVRAAGAGKGTDKAVASDLSAAVLRGYPDEPAGVVGVP